MADLYRAYACGDGGVLLAPEILPPSFHELHVHRELRLLGFVHCDGFPSDVCTEIKSQIETKLFVLVTIEQFSLRTKEIITRP